MIRDRAGPISPVQHILRLFQSFLLPPVIDVSLARRTPQFHWLNLGLLLSIGTVFSLAIAFFAQSTTVVTQSFEDYDGLSKCLQPQVFDGEYRGQTIGIASHDDSGILDPDPHYPNQAFLSVQWTLRLLPAGNQGSRNLYTMQSLFRSPPFNIRGPLDPSDWIQTLTQFITTGTDIMTGAPSNVAQNVYTLTSAGISSGFSISAAFETYLYCNGQPENGTANLLLVNQASTQMDLERYLCAKSARSPPSDRPTAASLYPCGACTRPLNITAFTKLRTFITQMIATGVRMQSFPRVCLVAAHLSTLQILSLALSVTAAVTAVVRMLVLPLLSACCVKVHRDSPPGDVDDSRASEYEPPQQDASGTPYLSLSNPSSS